MRMNIRLILIALFNMLLIMDSFAAGTDRGIMKVDFLYSIESTGGRGETLKSPIDIFYDRKKDELYIVDPGNGGIFIYNGSGVFIQKISFNRDGEEGSPKMIAVDGEGRLYVGHLSSPRISIFSYKGEPLDVLVLPGVIDVRGSDVVPLHLASGPDGGVYALKSSGGVVKVDPFGEKHEEISISGEGAPNVIYGITVDSDGSFLFADMRPYSVVRYDPKGKTFSRFGSPGVIYGQLARPIGVATDDSGHIFVTSLVRNNVLCYSREGEFIEEFGVMGKGYGQFVMPTKIASDGKDRLFVLEEPLKRVQVFRVKFLKENEGNNSSVRVYDNGHLIAGISGNERR
jgi:sugar lactone lactonase YvrE